MSCPDQEPSVNRHRHSNHYVFEYYLVTTVAIPQNTMNTGTECQVNGNYIYSCNGRINPTANGRTPQTGDPVLILPSPSTLLHMTLHALPALTHKSILPSPSHAPRRCGPQSIPQPYAKRMKTRHLAVSDISHSVRLCDRCAGVAAPLELTLCICMHAACRDRHWGGRHGKVGAPTSIIPTYTMTLG